MDHQDLWLPKDDLQDSISWSSPPLVLLRDIHSGLLANYDCKDSTTTQSQSGGRARVGHRSPDGDSQQQETDPLLIPELNRLNEVFLVWGEERNEKEGK